MGGDSIIYQPNRGQWQTFFRPPASGPVRPRSARADPEPDPSPAAPALSRQPSPSLRIPPRRSRSRRVTPGPDDEPTSRRAITPDQAARVLNRCQHSPPENEARRTARAITRNAAPPVATDERIKKPPAPDRSPRRGEKDGRAIRPVRRFALDSPRPPRRDGTTFPQQRGDRRR